MVATRRPSTKRKTRLMNISLDVVEHEAAIRLADEETGGVRSVFIGRLIAERATTKFGPDWRDQIEAEIAEAAPLP